MLNKILIANRGEIACRIIRTARKLGVKTVAVYSDADAKALHVGNADEAVHIGPSPAPESYLRGDKIIAAAKATGAQGIHPGYGFLSENADFAAAVTKAGLKFIGPSADAMRALGGKAAAKELAIKAGVPVVPGYQGDKQDAKSLATEAKKIGYPVMIKAVAGGGGRGMRLVEKEADLAELLASAQREAQGAFGDPRVLIEKVVERPRHIEVQVFGDAHGNVVHLFERDCTLQRRNQKVVEEAPAPGMTPELREKMCGAAVKLANAVGYEGAGTVEFLVEGGSLGADAKWYFIEMNTRLQVEHPVTEEITGLDLVEWQLRVASGEKLPLAQDKITMSGHAIEVRLCAEDPAKGFLPSVGKIEVLHHDPFKKHARLEIGVREGDSVSPFYDSMIAKLIAAGTNRTESIEFLLRELGKLRIAGPQTNIRFLGNLLLRSDVKAGDMDTGLIARHLEERADGVVAAGALVVAMTELLIKRSYTTKDQLGEPSDDPWMAGDAFQLGPRRDISVPFTVDGKQILARVAWQLNPDFPGRDSRKWLPEIELDGHASPNDGANKVWLPSFTHQLDEGLMVVDRGVQAIVAFPTYDVSAVEDGASGSTIRAPINGKVARVFVKEGDTVAKGDRIAVVEAMKMEHVLHATRDGTIGKVAVAEGAQVNQGALIASLAE